MQLIVFKTYIHNADNTVMYFIYINLNIQGDQNGHNVGRIVRRRQKVVRDVRGV